MSAEGELIKVNLGCGNIILDGWVNVDKYNPKANVQADVLDLPFEDNSVDEVLLSHVIEHVSYRKTVDLLEEIHRILKPSGKFFIAYPDWKGCMEAFMENRNGERWKWWVQTLYGSQTDAGQYHVAPIITDRLLEQLREVGFGEFDVNWKGFPDMEIKCYKCEPLPWF